MPWSRHSTSGRGRTMKTNRRPRRLAFETCDSTPCTQCSSRAIVPPIRNQRSGIRNSGNSFISRFFTVFTFVSPSIHDFHAKKSSARIPRIVSVLLLSHQHQSTQISTQPHTHFSAPNPSTINNMPNTNTKNAQNHQHNNVTSAPPAKTHRSTKKHMPPHSPCPHRLPSLRWPQ